MLFAEAGLEGELVAAGGVDADDPVDQALVFGVLVLLALAVSVGADGAEVEDFLGVAVTGADIEDALTGVAAGLDVE